MFTNQSLSLYVQDPARTMVELTAIYNGLGLAIPIPAAQADIVAAIVAHLGLLNPGAVAAYQLPVPAPVPAPVPPVPAPVPAPVPVQATTTKSNAITHYAGIALIMAVIGLILFGLFSLFFRQPQQIVVQSPTQQVIVPTQAIPSTPAPAAGSPAASFIAPTESFCQLGVIQMTNNTASYSLSWDAVQGRAYMNDSLARDIQNGPAYCRSSFSSAVTLYVDAIAADIFVDGVQVNAGNGLILTGSVFEFIYQQAAVSNGHAFIEQ